MSLSHRQRHQLYRIESRLLRSDPKLAAMLGMFGRLAAGQRMPAWEQLAAAHDRIRPAAAQLRQAIVVLAAAVSLLLSATVALLAAAVLMCGRVRLRQPARQQASLGPRADGRPDPASSA